jgi:hypothetical protein
MKQEEEEEEVQVQTVATVVVCSVPTAVEAVGAFGWRRRGKWNPTAAIAAILTTLMMAANTVTTIPLAILEILNIGVYVLAAGATSTFVMIAVAVVVAR